MTRFAILRHAPTEWNETRQLQGRSDPSLSQRGRAAANHWRLPDAVDGFRWISSPLHRALETAECLSVRPTVEPALIEMSWGDWEGWTLAELRAADPTRLAEAEARGIDLTPPQGESPRQVQDRLRPLLARLAADGVPTGAVSHKGVIRALLALATGWDMLGKSPIKLQPATLHLFELSADGTPRLVEANLPPDPVTVRILIHVQHLLGTGHLQRAALIARALVADGAAVTLVTGGMALPGFRLDGGRIVQLPPLKATDAHFRTLVGRDDRPLDDGMKAERRQMLLDVFADSRPQVVVTETYPFGRRALRFELEPLIEAVRAARPRPALVGSIRDILVAKPDPVRRQAMVDRFLADYDRLLVHADPQLIRLDASLPEAPQLAERILYTGFVAPPPAPATADTPTGEVVVSAGGGVVGAALLNTALAARPLTRYARTPWRLITGRNLPETDVAALVRAAGDGVVIERFRADLPALFTRAALSISQAGYNTAIELLQARVPMVLVPFAEAAETEQTLRAQLLTAAGVAQMVEAATLDPTSLAAAIDRAGTPPALAVDLDGAGASARAILKIAAGRPS